MTREEIKKILECAIMAPSGENCQPWKFEARENYIDVFNVAARDMSLYNWEQRASYIANGAAIENIVIAAKEAGYDADVKLFPQPDKVNHVARIGLTKAAAPGKDLLYPFIFERCTNRKPFKNALLSDSDVTQLQNSIAQDGNGRFIYVQDDKGKKALGAAGAVNEHVMLSNPTLHHFFFSHVSWNKKEDDEKKMGFFIDTLELPKPMIPVFKMFRSWKLTNFMNKVAGFNKTISKQNGAIYSKAAGHGVITVNSKSPESFVLAGRKLQRIWLTATKSGLSLHPLTGVLFFKLQLEAGNTQSFNDDQISTINNGYQILKKSFGVNDNETIAFFFRIGQGGKPTARSSRYKLEEVSEIHT